MTDIEFSPNIFLKTKVFLYNLKVKFNLESKKKNLGVRDQFNEEWKLQWAVTGTGNDQKCGHKKRSEVSLVC